MRLWTAATLVIALCAPGFAQEVTNIDGHPALIFGTVGRPPRSALGYGQAVFMTPEALQQLGADANSVVQLRTPNHQAEVRVFPVIDENRRDTSIYMGRRVREAIGVEPGANRVEVIAIGGASPETLLPACGEPGTQVFQRVGLPPREVLDLGDAAFVRSEVLERMAVPAGTSVTVTVGSQSIEVPIHPLADTERLETSIYLRSTLRERLAIEEGEHQVAVRWDPALSMPSATASGVSSEEEAL